MWEQYRAGRGSPWEYDPGPPRNRSWPRMFAETPNYRALGRAVTGREAYRWHFGPMFYRGRLGDGQVKVLIVGQEGAKTSPSPTGPSPAAREGGCRTSSTTSA